MRNFVAVKYRSLSVSRRYCLFVKKEKERIRHQLEIASAAVDTAAAAVAVAVARAVRGGRRE